MDKEIIEAIARDAAELGRALAAEGIRTAEAQARIVAGAMPGIVTYETSTCGAEGKLRRARAAAGAGDEIPGAFDPFERTLEDPQVPGDGPSP